MPTLLSLESLRQDREYVVRQLEQIEDDVWGTSQLMWEKRLADLDQRIALLQADSESAAYASVALVFDGVPVIGTTNVRLDFAADALERYQAIVATAFAAQSRDDVPHRGRIPDSRESRLYISNIARGSFGFMLEEVPSDQAALLPTPLKGAVETTTKLIAALSTDDEHELNHHLEAVQPRLVAAIRNFTAVLAKAKASTKILAQENDARLSVEQLEHLTQQLDDRLSVNLDVTYTGTLVGVLPGSQRFEFQSESVEPGFLRGPIADELADQLNNDREFYLSVVQTPVEVSFRRVGTVRNGLLIQQQHILESVTPLPTVVTS